MKRIFKYILPFILSIFPFVTAAKVYINEVAWMGSKVVSVDSGQWWRYEWIELYNDTSEAVALDGWKIELYKDNLATSSDFIISPKGNILGNGYFLIGASDLISPSLDFNYKNLAGKFGNTGQLVVLKNGLDVMDKVDGSDKWKINGSSVVIGSGSAGDGKTAQRTDSGSWITATATPKALNASVSNSSNSSYDNSQNSTNASIEENSGSGDETIQIDSVTYDSSAYSSPFSLSQSTKEKRKIRLDVGRNRIVLTDSPVFFVGRLSDNSGKVVGGASFDWSFGDGDTALGQNVYHIYRAPGDYVVIEKANFENEEFVGKSLIKVISPAFSITGAGRDGGDSYIEIENSLPFEANLKGWQLRSSFNTYIFPSDTIILSGKKVRFYSSTTKINSDFKGQIELVSSLGRSFSSFSNKESGKTVDNTVDKSKDGPSFENNVDKVVDNKGKTDDYLDQLSKMAAMLGEMRNSFVAEMPIEREEDLVSKKVKSIILNEELNKFEPNLDKEEIASTSEDFLSATDTENRKIVTLDAPENKKGFWNFVKSLFWQ